jgi:hypothetical protein
MVAHGLLCMSLPGDFRHPADKKIYKWIIGCVLIYVHDSRNL